MRVTSRLPRSQANIDIDNMVVTFRWLARCTTHHISCSETLRWRSETGSGAQSVWASQCAWVKTVDASGLRGPACRRSAPRQQRHYHLNDIIWRDLKHAQIHTLKEPVGLIRQNGTRPDDSTILPWSRSKTLAWDVTVSDTYAEAHVVNSARQTGTAANLSANNKATKYDQLTRTHVFWNSGYLAPPDNRTGTTNSTSDPKETTYQFQQLTVAL